MALGVALTWMALTWQEFMTAGGLMPRGEGYVAEECFRITERQLRHMLDESLCRFHPPLS